MFAAWFFFSARAFPKRGLSIFCGLGCVSPLQPRKTLENRGFWLCCRLCSGFLWGDVAVWKTKFAQFSFRSVIIAAFRKICLAWAISHYISEGNGDFPEIFRSSLVCLREIWLKIVVFIIFRCFLVWLAAYLLDGWWIDCTRTTKKKKIKQANPN